MNSDFNIIAWCVSSIFVVGFCIFIFGKIEDVRKEMNEINKNTKLIEIYTRGLVSEMGNK